MAATDRQWHQQQGHHYHNQQRQGQHLQHTQQSQFILHGNHRSIVISEIRKQYQEPPATVSNLHNILVNNLLSFHKFRQPSILSEIFISVARLLYHQLSRRHQQNSVQIPLQRKLQNQQSRQELLLLQLQILCFQPRHRGRLELSGLLQSLLLIGCSLQRSAGQSNRRLCGRQWRR